MRLKLRAKFIVGIVGLTVVSVLAVSAVFFLHDARFLSQVVSANVKAVESSLNEKSRRESHEMARLLSAMMINPLYRMDVAAIGDLLVSVREQEDMRQVLLLGADGTVLHDGTDTLAAYGKPLAEAVVLPQDFSPTTEQTWRDGMIQYSYTPIMIGSQRIGGVCLGRSLDEFQNEMGKLTRTLGEISDSAMANHIATTSGAFLILTLLAGLLGLFVAEHFTQPIKTLAEITHDIGEGGARVKIPFQRSDEIGELGAALQGLAERLEKTTLSKAQVESILNNMLDPLLVVGGDGRVELVNLAASQLFGVTFGELLGKPWREFGACDCAPREDSSGICETTLTLEAGRKVPVLMSAAILENWNGSEGSVITLRDISARVAAEQALQRSHDELEDRVYERTEELHSAMEQLEVTVHKLSQSNTELERFAYIASHDLQEPLRSVVSYTQLLEKRYKGKLDEDADEYLSYVVEGGKRMSALIKDLLAYSRAQRTERVLTQVDANRVLGAARANLRDQIARSSALIESLELPVVLGDEIQLIQLFQNLLGNAIKFVAKGTTPKITITCRWEEVTKMWEFSFADNGIGIDPHYNDRIFTLFQRLHRHEDYEGTGIGLALCRRIVDTHGGSIWLNSVPGKGATFFFTLPGTENEITARAVGEADPV